MQLAYTKIHYVAYSYSDASVTGLNGITTPSILLHRNFYCTGDEARLMDCGFSNVDINTCGNKRVGLMCETGKFNFSSNTCCYIIVQNVNTDDMAPDGKPQPAVLTVTVTPSCSIPLSTRIVVSSPSSTVQQGPQFIGILRINC